MNWPSETFKGCWCLLSILSWYLDLSRSKAMDGGICHFEWRVERDFYLGWLLLITGCRHCKHTQGQIIYTYILNTHTHIGKKFFSMFIFSDTVDFPAHSILFSFIYQTVLTPEPVFHQGLHSTNIER